MSARVLLTLGSPLLRPYPLQAGTISCSSWTTQAEVYGKLSASLGQVAHDSELQCIR